MKGDSQNQRTHYLVAKRTTQEELKMWRKAHEYYRSNGWDDLAEAAEKQIKRVSEVIDREFVYKNHYSSSMMRLAKEKDVD